MREWLLWRDLDPVRYRERIHIPVLLIFGSVDDAVPMEVSVERITAAFRDEIESY